MLGVRGALHNSPVPPPGLCINWEVMSRCRFLIKTGWGTPAPRKGGWANQGQVTLPSLAWAKGKTCETDMLGQPGTPKGDRGQDGTKPELSSFSSWCSEESREKPGITLREHLCWDGRFRVGQGIAPRTRTLGWGTPGLDSGPKTYQPIKWASSPILLGCCSSYINADAV